MLKPGDSIDAWIVEKPIGSGGMGSVYRCRNRHASRILAAIKTLDATLIRQVPEAAKRFVREAEILFAIDHPNVVKVRNVRLDVETPYLEMEFIEGESLESRLCKGPCSLPEAVDWMSQLLDAISYLHDKGIRHRDIKPANLLIDLQGTLKVVDFGLAAEADVSRITRQNSTFGTVGYAPPEWIRPDELDPEAWDVYAAGVVLWEMLTGRVAFPGSPHLDPRHQAVQIMTVKQSHPALDPGPSYLEDVRKLCRDLTEPDLGKRLTNAREASHRLRQLDRAPTPPPVMPADFPGSPRKSRPAPSSMAKSARPSLPEPSTPAKRSTSAKSAVLIGVGAMGGLGAFLLVIAFGIFGLWAVQPKAPQHRNVEVMIAGLARETPVSLRLGDQSANATDGFRYKFDAIPPGDVQLSWVIGASCPVEACPGAKCPTWCITGDTVFKVTAGTDLQQFNIELSPPASRKVSLDATAMAGGLPVTAKLGEQPGTPTGSKIAFDNILPSSYSAEVTAGKCGPEAVACANAGKCPTGCVSWKGDVIVPLGSEVFTYEVPALVAAVKSKEPHSVKAPPTEPSRPVEIKPKAPIEPETSPVGKGVRVVTRNDFARWLEDHPDWTRDSAIARGKASHDYLSDWEDGKPKKGSAPMVFVTWTAAQAYCKSRGGLPPLDAPPLTWTESADQPFQEWRSKDGAPAYRRKDGTNSPSVKTTDSNNFTGFRCAR